VNVLVVAAESDVERKSTHNYAYDVYARQLPYTPYVLNVSILYHKPLYYDKIL